MNDEFIVELYSVDHNHVHVIFKKMKTQWKKLDFTWTFVSLLFIKSPKKAPIKMKLHV